MQCRGLLIEAGILGLGVAVGSGGEDEGAAGEGKHYHTVMLILVAAFHAPNLLRLVISDGIKLTHFQALPNHPQTTVALPSCSYCVYLRTSLIT